MISRTRFNLAFYVHCLSCRFFQMIAQEFFEEKWILRLTFPSRCWNDCCGISISTRAVKCTYVSTPFDSTNDMSSCSKIFSVNFLLCTDTNLLGVVYVLVPVKALSCIRFVTQRRHLKAFSLLTLGNNAQDFYLTDIKTRSKLDASKYRYDNPEKSESWLLQTWHQRFDQPQSLFHTRATRKQRTRRIGHCFLLEPPSQTHARYTQLGRTTQYVYLYTCLYVEVIRLQEPLAHLQKTDQLLRGMIPSNVV